MGILMNIFSDIENLLALPSMLIRTYSYNSVVIPSGHHNSGIVVTEILETATCFLFESFNRRERTFICPVGPNGACSSMPPFFNFL